MKKVLLFLLFITLGFSLLSCGNEEQKKDNEDNTQDTGNGNENQGGNSDHQHLTCPECGKCKDSTCTGEKCEGHTPAKNPINVDAIVFESKEFPYTGSEIYLECENVPDNALVSYENNGKIEVGTYEVVAIIFDEDFEEVGRKTATLTIVESNIEDDENGGNGGEDKEDEVDLEKIIFVDQTVKYTGSPLYVSVRNMHESLTAKYEYKLDGTVIEEMIEVGVYEVTASIQDGAGTVLKTLTATITVTDEEIFDEIPKDAESNIELTYTDHYVLMFKNPDDPTQLIAARIDLWAMETFMFVLDRDTTLGAYNEPLNFFNLSADSVECASLVDNKLIIGEAGVYDIILIFPQGEKVPTILVTESGEEDNTLYFRSSLNDFAADASCSFTVDGNEATYEVTLAAGDVFRIANYYSSLSFNFDPYFTGMNEFEAAEEVGAVKVFVPGKYKFTVNMETKTIVVTRDGVRVEQDTNMLYIRGTVNENPWASFESVLRKNNGIAIIEIEFPMAAEFKIANADWSTIYDASYFTSASSYFGASSPDNNVIVKQAGLYRIELNVNANTITVKFNGNVIIENASGSNGGNQGGGQTTYSYQLVINGTQKINLTHKGDAWVDGVKHDEFVAYNVKLNAGDVITLYDVNNNAGWAITNVNPWSSGAPVGSATGITIGQSGNYDIYVQFLFENDKIYFGPAGA